MEYIICLNFIENNKNKNIIFSVINIVKKDVKVNNKSINIWFMYVSINYTEKIKRSIFLFKIFNPISQVYVSCFL